MTKRRTKWEREEVLALITQWAADHGGVPPAASDWHPGDCRRSARISAARSAAWLARAEYTESREFPWPRTVQRLFGSWNQAIEAAGLQPRRTSIGDGELSAGATVDDVVALAAEAKAAKKPEVRRQLLYRLAETALAAAG